MAEVDVTASKPKFVELGRIVLFNEGKHEGKIAVIVEIIDHKRVLVDGPSESLPRVPRHDAPLSHLLLTSIVMDKLPRGIRTGKLEKKWKAQEIDTQWKKTSTYRARERREKRKNMTDFDRFVCMKLKKQRRHEIRKAQAEVRKEEAK